MNIRIQSARRPFEPFLMVIGILILGGIVAACMKGNAWLYELLPIAIIIFIGTSNTFTTAITLTDQQIIIEYFQYLRKRTLQIDTRHAQLVLEKHTAFAGRKQVPIFSYLLKVFEQQELKYVLNSDEWFPENRLFELVNAFNSQSQLNRV